MSDMRNFMVITGNLGQDPVVKSVSVKGKDKKVTEGSIAYTPRGKDEPCWYNFEIWGDTAAKLVGGLSQGDKLQINGEFIYTTGDEGKRYYKLIGDGFELMSARSSKSESEEDKEAA